MKLKTRLIIAFFVIIFVPVFLTSLALFGFGRYQLNSIEETYGIKDPSYDTLSNSVQMVSKFTQKSFEEMQDQAGRDPDMFLDRSYLDTLNEKLSGKASYLIVRRGGEMYYSGKEENIDALFEELPPYGDYNKISDSGVYIGKDVQAFVKQMDVDFTDGSEGSVFIITSVSATLPQIKSLVRDMVIAIIVILIFTAGFLTMWIYNGISTPLKKLKLATQNIKEGNLDFTMEAQGDDEISGLCRDFEQMRRRLKESAEEKVQYDRENKELISNISHDLKTPITAVKGYVEGIMDGVADTPEKMDKYIRTIYNKANDMDRLINELTFYSKIDTNRIPYTFNKINIKDYFDDCIEEVGLDLESKNIELSYFNYADADTIVIADAEQLKRVINNIISNSVKYMDKPKGYINIRVKDVGDFIQVEIEDNGKGIATKDLSNVFDRFYRTDASRNSSQGGSGIGLSIVKKIIEDHGGKIWVSSKLGAGTIMYFVLRKYQEVPIDE
ncbi:sensor histidine kinase [Murimonas intestini]|uniref:histidine kinase n=1 Tax=Murimonas intestini TaxID=1337051 RepID=A0AB73T0P1_9FIRM|nr:HAMP domain-containing sensor histidine kinase [Murimonas intestini]MCR1840199.1 HAMP domain-containing histidine kinase [Murimonas intestini]MCR1867651.1 HAMP domain-containing histidine kinase [Murimonas intestini]MCR1884934.1 HAMP domain-containing histidine kinase [Murimonas intestini]